MVLLGVGLIVIGGCHQPTPVTPVTPVTSDSPAERRASAAPSAAPSVATMLPAFDLAPATDTLLLRGTLQLDAAKALALGGATIIGTDPAGGPLLATGGGDLISKIRFSPDDGSSLISKIRFTPGEGSLLLAMGQAAIAPNGQSLISTSGTAITSGPSGNLVSTTQVVPSYRLQAATPALPPGTMLPAAGMQLGVESLVTHKLLPIGQDAAGNPVYSVYSNLQGGYELYVASSVGETVQLVATSGPQIELDLLDLPATDPSPRVVGDATSVTTQFVRQAFALDLQTIIKLDGTAETGTFAALAAPLLADFRTRGRLLPTSQLPAATRRATDRLLADANVLTATTRPDARWASFAPGAPAMQAVAMLTQLMWHMYEGAAQGIQQDGAVVFNAKLLQYLQAHAA